MRKAWRLLVVAVLVTACATAPPAPTALLRITCNVPEAAVLVDDRFVGRAGALAGASLKLPVGFHRLEIRDVDHYTFFAELDLRAGAVESIDAQLHRRLD